MRAFGFLCIRSGSKGITDKNIVTICGKPLFYWILKAAYESSCLDDIYVSSDSAQYLALVKEFFPRIQALFRPIHLSQDSSLEVDVVRYHIDTLSRKGVLCPDDIILRLHATSPLQTPSDILETLELLRSDSRLTSSIFVKKCSFASEKLLYLETNNHLSCPIARSVIDGTSESVTPRNRQDFMTRYQRANIIAVYVRVILETSTLTGSLCGALVSSELRIDIDSHDDLFLASLVMQYNHSLKSNNLIA
jgi:CMP-N-acetylneuraminic acid synthetase